MDILNQITNTKPVADSFVNDQLKWRRERIEFLTKKLIDQKTLYKNECKFVRLMRLALEDIIKISDCADSPEAKKLLDTIDIHINNQKINNEH